MKPLGAQAAGGLGAEPVLLALPFRDRWLVQNSPARRIPSHGTNQLGLRYAIDFVGVDHRRRSANTRDWRTFLATEPVDRYIGFGRPILAPADGVVASVHDGEVDHAGRRSQVALVPYMLGQARRLRQGAHAISGNHVTIELAGGAGYVVLAHLRSGSLRVRPGETIATGQMLAECGNSGNSTEPHVHVQVMDRPGPAGARGIPITFGDFREWARGVTEAQIRHVAIPAEGAVVEAVDWPASVARPDLA